MCRWLYFMHRLLKLKETSSKEALSAVVVALFYSAALTLILI